MTELEAYKIRHNQGFMFHGDFIEIPEDTEQLVHDIFGHDVYWSEVVLIMDGEGHAWVSSSDQLRRLWKQKYFEEHGGVL